MGLVLDDSRDLFAKKAGHYYGYLERIKELKVPPTDPRALAGFLKRKAGTEKNICSRPWRNISSSFTAKSTVGNGPGSFAGSVINDKTFPYSVGTVFLEISAHSQRDLDRFLSKATMDPELILDALRDIQIYGWHDKGMFEFILDVWKLNKTLPLAKKIRLVAADYPRPFRQFKTFEELDRYFRAASNRNAFMADRVETGIRSNQDGRHSLFIVGCGHAYKSAAPGTASSYASRDEVPTAGALLSARFPKENIFIIFSHTLAISNDGKIFQPIRSGAFDAAFRLNGDTPVAFYLDHGPFGQEPIDALPEIAYNPESGMFADNYDGYVFLGPLDLEPSDYVLYELYSDDFVKELTRRAKMDNATLKEWFGVEEADRDSIIAQIKKEHEGKKRWAK